MTDAHSIDDLIAELTETHAAVSSLLDDARERQWSPGVLKSGGAPTGASETGYSDPTGETAADPRRLRLRLAVIEAERALDEFGAVLRRSRRHLDDALVAWAGEKH